MARTLVYLMISAAMTVQPALAVSQRPGVAPGDYVYEGGRGSLQVDGSPGKGQVFAIKTLSRNAQSCTLEGTLRGMEGRMRDPKGSGEYCVVELEPEQGGVQITAVSEEPCRAYCEGRAVFEGLYIRPKPECRPPEVRLTRAESKARSAEKDYVTARALLSRLIDRCEPVIDPFELMWIRNDLAILQHHAGDDAGCLATLQGLQALAQEKPGEVGVGEPSDAQTLQRIAQATRANLETCRTARASPRVDGGH